MVATEVKALATQTAKATEEIAAQIAASRARPAIRSSAIEGIGGTIGRINEIATTIASAVEEQGAATQEIARNVQQAARDTEVSANITGVTQAAGETGAAASQVLGAAGRSRHRPRPCAPRSISSWSRSAPRSAVRRFRRLYPPPGRGSHAGRIGPETPAKAPSINSATRSRAGSTGPGIRCAGLAGSA